MEQLENFTYEIHRKMLENNVVLAFTGEFDIKIVDTLINVIKKKLSTLEIDPKVIKKVYNVTVECLENIFRHAENLEDNDPHLKTSGIFTVNKENNFYFLTSGNFVFNKNIKNIKDRIDTVNELSTEEIKKLYWDTLKNGQRTEHGGSGLGIMEMAMKSGNKLKYEFKPLTNETSFYIFQVQVEV